MSFWADFPVQFTFGVVKIFVRGILLVMKSSPDPTHFLSEVKYTK